MSEKLEEIPLFPLETVLFPYAALQLHIFEERYRSMVRECVDHDKPFGIVLIRSGQSVGENAEPYMVGTAVRIVQVYTYEDGRLDIQVQGERRFRIRRIDESRPFMVGFVEPVVELDIQDTEFAQYVISRARDNFQTFVEGLFARQDFNVQVRFPTDPVALSFTIANLLTMENLEKQRLLELTDTVERLQGLVPILERNILEAKTQTYRRLRPEDLREWIHVN
jgi:Lon protease-like protein